MSIKTNRFNYLGQLAEGCDEDDLSLGRNLRATAPVLNAAERNCTRDCVPRARQTASEAELYLHRDTLESCPPIRDGLGKSWRRVLSEGVS